MEKPSEMGMWAKSWRAASFDPVGSSDEIRYTSKSSQPRAKRLDFHTPILVGHWLRSDWADGKVRVGGMESSRHFQTSYLGKALQQPEDGPVKKSHKAIIGKSTIQPGDRHMGIVKRA